jgi:ABC-type amino acid transport substrate-binding protein
MSQMDESGNRIDEYKEKRLGTIYNSGTYEWLRNNLFKNKVTFNSVEEMFFALDNGSIDAIAYDHPVLNSMLADETLAEKYSILNIKYDPQFYGIGMRENLPEETKDIINLSMLEITERLDWEVILMEYGLK